MKKICSTILCRSSQSLSAFQPPLTIYCRRSFSTMTPPNSHTQPSTPTKDIGGIISKFIEKIRKKSFVIDEKSPLTFPTPATATTTSSHTQTNSLINKFTNKNVNPFEVVSEDLKTMNSDIFSLLINGVGGSSMRAGGPPQTTHPFLSKIATYYFEMKGKRLRPTVALLVAHAVAPSLTTLPQTQHKLAEIIEMIHTASLLHDDVVDESDTRRDHPSANAAFSNKMAILAGDFLLARASISLASLKNFEVTELMSSVLGDLIEGEFMQLKVPKDVSTASKESMEYYLRKTFLKTASLIANGCRCAAILAGASRDVVDAATDYGKNLGLAFQIVDDLLDFTGTDSTLGKPAGADLSLGLATAPVLYASEQFPELSPLILRRFKNEGDVLLARELVAKSDGIQRSHELARYYCNLAIESLHQLSPSLALDALYTLTQIVISRTR
eukprot:TRINITY_DN6460_c1_g2_i1.p1 TRINITY_DN6460_c1_g2~~TRINITY_DN6460_c1_g2_i1.p1  ORF type:complete len:442 (-),score=81.21 TRINITY_DN6460_c1_g2_i1:69-1394(-)